VATQTERTVVYAAGVVQGIALLTFPAASTILTDPSEYDLSNTQYGALFLPQVITAITAALLGARLGGRAGPKRVYLVGLSASLAAMVLLLVSSFLTGDETLAYVLLLLATASLGAGFGFAVPALNTFTAAFNPGAVDRSILVLNALLGLGTVLAPVCSWPSSTGSASGGGCHSRGSPACRVDRGESGASPCRPRAPARHRSHRARDAGALLDVRGHRGSLRVCETVNGKWSQLDMTSELGASTTQAALALTAFWAMVTVGRVFFAAVQRVFPPRLTYHVLPFVLAGAFVLIALLPDDEPALGIAAFGLAGLGCSALLPLTISFGQEELSALSAAVAGGVIAAYQLGYGIAAFGVGPLLDGGVELPTIYAVAAVVAVAMGLLSFVVAGREPRPSTPHTQPG
jgi:MFS family permease